MGDLAFIVAGLCVIVAVALIVIRLGRVEGNVDWIYAWLAVLVAGLDLMLVTPGHWLNVISPLYDHLFALFLLTGSLRFAGYHGCLKRLWTIGTVVLVLRLTIQPFLPGITGMITATFVIFICSVASMALIYQYGKRLHLGVTQLLSLAFLGPALAQAYLAYLALLGTALSAGFLSYLMTCSVLAMAQLIMVIERARRQTITNRETLALMAQTAPVGLCLTDPDGKLTAVNPVASSLLDIDERAERDFNAYVEKLLGTKMEAPPARSFIHTDDGRYLSVHRQAIPVAEQHAGDLWFFEDLTVHRQLGELIPRAENLELIKNMSGNIAHIFNNKLTAISGNVEMIDRVNANAEVSEYVSALRAATEQCIRVTEDFRYLTQQIPYAPAVINAGETLAEFHHPLAEIDDLQSLQLKVDSAGFRRAFSELFRNAEEAGATKVTISCILKADGFAELVFKDNGTGMPDDIVNRIFEPFFSTKEQPLGSGLGLSVVDGIVRSHGGDVRLVSNYQGVEIALTWPLAK